MSRPDHTTEEEPMATSLVVASVWEEELYEHLTSHVENESGLLEAYQQAAAESGSGAFCYLVSLIVEDEMRHHRVFEELAEALRSDAELRPEDPKVPRLDGWGANPKRLVELTEQLIAQEEHDAREFRRLARELHDVKDTTLWRLLVQLMEMDTAKHLVILEFARRHAKRRR
jgi:rubrerythrin